LLRIIYKIVRHDDEPESAGERARDETFWQVWEKVGVDWEGVGAGYDVTVEAGCGVVDGDVQVLGVFADDDVVSVAVW
jgi:hypothetical protein